MAPISENDTTATWRLNPIGSSEPEATGPYYFPGFYSVGLYERYRRLHKYKHSASRPNLPIQPSHDSCNENETRTTRILYRRLGRPDPPDPVPNFSGTHAPTPPSTPEPEVAPEEKVPDLTFVDLDLMVSENRFEHHTVRYAYRGLIVRRGQAFKIGVNLSDTFNKETDRIVLKFMKGSSPDYSKGTCFLVSSDADEDDYLANGWKASISDVTDKHVTLAVNSDPDSVIGHFKVTVKVKRTSANGKVKVSEMNTEMTLIILFNAFLPEDDAYIEDDKEREEYVMNDVGLVYTSIYRPRYWNYGQFEKDILEVALYLMDICGDLPSQSHGNIIRTLRAMSAMVNAIGDNGVLVGNWSGKYGDGTAPTRWNGSVSILRQYWKTKKPVKYAQCWVFAAVLNTVMRALGLSTRTVTNFNSAHDSDRSMTIDKYVNEEGDPIKSRNSDSTWNFHVWNECWCKRPDLPKGYDGWQVFDSTPQEISNGKYQCGPCPVSAIFKGEVYIPYEGHFIFAEVNSDTIYWMVNRDGSEIPYAIDTDAVGGNMSTKMPGGNQRLDITENYKAKEGSALERRGAINAMRRNKRNWEKIKEQYEKITKDWDVVFDLKATIDSNEDCHFHIDITNNADQIRVIMGRIHVYASYNVGISREDLRDPLSSKITINAGDTESVKWDMPATEYFSKLDDDASLLLHAAFLVEDTNQVWSQAKVIEVMKPEITVTLNKEQVMVGDEFEVTVSFINPVKVDLTEVEVNLEGPGISDSKELNVSKTLKAEESLEVTAVLTAERPGDKTVVASIDSRQLMGLSGVAHIKVTGEELD